MELEESECYWCEVRITRSSPRIFWVCDYESADCDFHPIAYDTLTVARTGDTGPHQSIAEVHEIIRSHLGYVVSRQNKIARLRSVDSNVVSISKSPRKTSRDAANKILPRSGTIRRMVFNEIVRSGGLTDHQLEINLNGKHQTISASRRSLVVDGFVVDSGTTRKNPQGNDCIVWQSAEKNVNQEALKFYV